MGKDINIVPELSWHKVLKKNAMFLLIQFIYWFFIAFIFSYNFFISIVLSLLFCIGFFISSIQIRKKVKPIFSKNNQLFIEDDCYHIGMIKNAEIVYNFFLGPRLKLQFNQKENTRASILIDEIIPSKNFFLYGYDKEQILKLFEWINKSVKE